jgi:hypothetical protein
VLKIERVSSSCGCTVAKPEQNEIPPDGSTAIHAVFDLKGRSGKQEKTITVYSNDPQEPQLKLTLKGEIIKQLDISPPALLWGRISDSSPLHKQFTIASALPFEVTKIHITDSHIEAELVGEVSLDAAGRTEYTFEARLVPPFAEGRLAGNIEITTTLQNAPLVTIPFAAYYTP